ncbi:MAG TPA: hypothetical protein VFZ64_15560 [Nocardioidaceae bacterium]
MNEPTTAPSSPGPPVWWALGLGVVSSVGLAALTAWVFVVDAIGYGAATLFAMDAVEAPDGDRYRLAFAVGMLVTLASAATLAWLGQQTPGRTWPPAVQGLVAALCAAVAGSCVLLLTLGISPIGFVAAL